MRIAPTTARRSCAIGWRLAISVMARSSSSRCRASMIASSEMTRCASALSDDSSARIEAATIDAGEIAHVADEPLDVIEFVVEGSDGMFAHERSLSGS